MNTFTILLIDDVEAVVEVFAEALAARGFNVLTALSGKDGVKLFRENHVDIILCDLGMPHMDGWEVARCITRTCEQLGRIRPPFVLVTAWAGRMNGDEKIADAGVDAILGKPVHADELCHAIERALAEHRE